MTTTALPTKKAPLIVEYRTALGERRYALDFGYNLVAPGNRNWSLARWKTLATAKRHQLDCCRRGQFYRDPR